MSLAEYLATSYRPDCEYLDGIVVERNLGERDHSRLQGKLYILLSRYEESSELFAFPEQRLQVKSRRYRVPDICVTRGLPPEQIFTTPPLLCVEVLSPEDSLGSMRDRINDYLVFGVENIWLIDPKKKLTFIADAMGIHEVSDAVLSVAGTPIRVDVKSMWPE